MIRIMNAPETPMKPALPSSSASGKEAERKDASVAGTVMPPEIGGRKGPEPTRYGDWEKKGRCTDF